MSLNISIHFDLDVVNPFESIDTTESMRAYRDALHDALSDAYPQQNVSITYSVCTGGGHSLYVGDDQHNVIEAEQERVIDIENRVWESQTWLRFEQR